MCVSVRAKKLLFYANRHYYIPELWYESIALHEMTSKWMSERCEETKKNFFSLPLTVMGIYMLLWLSHDLNVRAHRSSKNINFLSTRWIFLIKYFFLSFIAFDCRRCWSCQIHFTGWGWEARWEFRSGCTRDSWARGKITSAAKSCGSSSR